jgi:hypothetical protein
MILSNLVCHSVRYNPMFAAKITNLEDRVEYNAGITMKGNP